MTDYKVTDTELTGIANAIRTKGGTSSPLVFPTGFVSAIGDIPSGGSIPILSRADWNALTTAQKQAYGQLVIQDKSTGFKRGDFVYGADYNPAGYYIPYSNAGAVICEAYTSIFSQNMDFWGNGSTPVALIGLPKLGTDDSVEMDAPNGHYGYVDLGQGSTPFTAYIVGKTVDAGQYSRILSAMLSRYHDDGILLFGSPNVIVSSWGSDTSTGIPSNGWFAGAIQYAGASSAKGIAGNSDGLSSFIYKSPSRAGRYVTIGRTDINDSTSNAEPCNVHVKYIAVVTEAETEATITSNLQNLITEFVA